MERGRCPVAVLPTAGPGTHRHPHPGRGPLRPGRAGTPTRGRCHVAGRARLAARHTHRVDGRLRRRRERPGRARPRTRPVQPRQPEPAPLHGGVPGSVPTSTGGTQPSNHRLGQKDPGHLRSRGHTLEERGFVTHGTMADPRWLDLSLDPNDREPGCYLGDPQIVNNGPVALARFSTLRSWLSQWSYDDAHGDGPRCAADLRVPTLVIGNSADNACTPSHTQRLYEAVGHPDKTMHTVQGATHYYSGPDQGPKLAEAVSVITEWMGDRGWAKTL